MPSEQEYAQRFFRDNPDVVEKLKAMKDKGILSDASDVADSDAITIVGGPDPRGIVGSKQVRCSCGAAIWVSPSSQAVMARVRKYTVSCLACAMAMVEAANQAKQ